LSTVKHNLTDTTGKPEFNIIFQCLKIQVTGFHKLYFIRDTLQTSSIKASLNKKRKKHKIESFSKVKKKQTLRLPLLPVSGSVQRSGNRLISRRSLCVPLVK